MELIPIKKEIVKIGRILYERGYVVSSFGNISARVGERIVITPSGERKGELEPEDLVIVSKDGEVLEGTKTPSMELFMHLFIYEVRGDVNAIIHAHPPYLTAFSFSMPRECEPYLPELKRKLGVFGFVSYKPPGSMELAEAAKERVKKHKILILQKHGVVALGHNLIDALNLLEEAEFDIKVRYYKATFPPF